MSEVNFIQPSLEPIIIPEKKKQREVKFLISHWIKVIDESKKGEMKESERIVIFTLISESNKYLKSVCCE